MDWNDDETEVTVTLEGELFAEPHVARLTPTLAGRVELEGWVTSTGLTAANYNNSRSNKSTIRAHDGDGDADSDGVDDDVRGEDYNSPRSNRSIAGPSDIIDDDIDEDDETFRRVSRLDAQLEGATTAAAAAISKRSARTGRNPETEKEITEALGDMEAVLAEMRAVLERCSDESCVAALANVVDREADVVRAQEHAQDGEWEAFGLDSGGDGNDILVGDYLLPPVEFDSSGLFSPGEQAELFRYLEQKPVVAERFSVCLPDAEVPGGNGSIEDAVTPERLFAYLTGRSDGEGKVYSWGHSEYAGPDESGDCDDVDSTVSPGAVCGATPHFVAEMTGPVATGGGLVAERTADGHVVITNSPPSAEAGASVVVCPVKGEPFEPEGLDAWAKKMDDVPVEITQQGRLLNLTVAQVMVQPPGCPEPVPALMYVGRGRSDGQLMYSGGWIIDDAALYENSTTVLSMARAAQVVGIECCFDYSADADGDGLSDLVARAGLSERARRGAQMDSGTVDELVKAGVFSADSFDPESPVVNDFIRSRSGGGSGSRVALTHVAADAPVLHLVNAASASDEVKFKTGAELSKSVN
ncbi:hypothetical protein [Halovenus sp. HT40]|uniref:hypothetical protein n=1 Tax=Halovenus sp. HT40 TaxID=3126691 RepID=UPI00300F2F6C